VVTTGRPAAPGRSGRVDEQAGEVVAAGIHDAAGQEPRRGRRARVTEVRGIGPAPPAALAAAVHDQVRVAGAAPAQPVERVAAAAAVADELDDDGTPGTPVVSSSVRLTVRLEQPALDRVTAVTREGHVVDGRVPNLAADGGERRPGAVRAGGGELAGPEVSEVSGLGDVGPVVAELGQRKIGEHGCSVSSGVGGTKQAIER